MVKSLSCSVVQVISLDFSAVLTCLPRLAQIDHRRSVVGLACEAEQRKSEEVRR
jgi:hypothetical protein